jgi:hypothetical protein
MQNNSKAKLLKSSAAAVTIIAALVISNSTGVFGAFLRTMGATLSPVADVSYYLFGYGYDTNTGLFGYGYGYGYDGSVLAGTSVGGAGGGAAIPSNAPSVSVIPTIGTGVNTSGNQSAPTLPKITPKPCGTEVVALNESQVTQFLAKNGLSTRSQASSITRAEFIKLIVTSLGVTVTTPSVAPFSDVRKTSRYSSYIAYAKAVGIIDGSATKFRPSDALTRSEMTKIIVLTMGEKPSQKSSVFADTSASTSISGYVQRAFELCIVRGRTSAGNTRTFEPRSSLTIAEAAKVIINSTGR